MNNSEKLELVQKNDKLQGGFMSLKTEKMNKIKGGVINNSSNCSNSGTCSATNSGTCTNTGSCSGSSNTGLCHSISNTSCTR